MADMRMLLSRLRHATLKMDIALEKGGIIKIIAAEGILNNAITEYRLACAKVNNDTNENDLRIIREAKDDLMIAYGRLNDARSLLHKA